MELHLEHSQGPNALTSEVQVSIYQTEATGSPPVGRRTLPRGPLNVGQRGKFVLTTTEDAVKSPRQKAGLNWLCDVK